MGHARNPVFAVSGLPVARCADGADFAGFEVAQEQDDGGCADIERSAVQPAADARPQLNDAPACMDSRGHRSALCRNRAPARNRRARRGRWSVPALWRCAGQRLANARRQRPDRLIGWPRDIERDARNQRLRRDAGDGVRLARRRLRGLAFGRDVDGNVSHEPAPCKQGGMRGHRCLPGSSSCSCGVTSESARPGVSASGKTTRQVPICPCRRTPTLSPMPDCHAANSSVLPSGTRTLRAPGSKVTDTGGDPAHCRTCSGRVGSLA